MAENARLYKGVSANELKAALSYDLSSGQLHWLVSPSNRVRIGERAGKVTSQGYRVIGLKGRQLREHIVAWAIHYGEFPVAQVDHRDLNKANNKIANLRLCTPQQNSANRGVPFNSATNAKGVTFVKAKGRYRAHIRVDGVQRHLGLFPTIEAASAAYAKAASANFGDFSR